MSFLKDNEQYQQHLAQFNEYARIMEKSAKFNPKLLKGERVRLEMRFIAPLELALAVSELAYKWLTTGNPYYIDQAQLICYQNNVTPSPSLTELIQDVLMKRFSYNSSLAGTSEKILNEQSKTQALYLMLNLHYAGDPLHICASKAAKWHSEQFPEHKQLKASTLETYYVKTFRTASDIETEYFKAWLEFENSDPEFKKMREHWNSIKTDLPESDDNLKGYRR